MIELPTRRVQDYLSAFSVAAVFAATCDGRPTAVAAALDPGRAIAAMERRTGRRLEPICIMWLPDRAKAERIAQRARSALPAIGGALLDADAGEAEHVIRRELRSAVYTEHTVAMARAKRNAERLDRALAQAQARGELQFFNRAYRQYREDAARRGVPVLSYQQARTRLQRTVLANLTKGEWERLSPPIMQRVLPGSAAFFQPISTC